MPDDRADTHKCLRTIALFEAANAVFAPLVAGAFAAIGPDALQHKLQRMLARFGVDAKRSGSAMLMRSPRRRCTSRSVSQWFTQAMHLLKSGGSGAIARRGRGWA